jgi:hypothetical protein
MRDVGQGQVHVVVSVFPSIRAKRDVLAFIFLATLGIILSNLSRGRHMFFQMDYNKSY